MEELSKYAGREFFLIGGPPGVGNFSVRFNPEAEVFRYVEP